MFKKNAAFITLLAAITFGLSGCSGTPFSTTTEAEKFGAIWASDPDLNAPKIAQVLKDEGICQSLPSLADGVYGGDILEEYKKNAFILCYGWPDSVEDPTSLTCASTFYISAGKDAEMYDPKRTLSYEDGMSVALFYADNYQIEISPANGPLKGEETVGECAGLVQQMKDLVGGNVTMFGDYTPEQYQDDNSGSSNNDQSSDTVEMPNLVNQIDGQAKNWLFNNGYRFMVNIKSTGFNPRQSCLMSGQNYILDQNPQPGSMISNSSSTQVTFYVDCEF